MKNENENDKEAEVTVETTPTKLMKLPHENDPTASSESPSQPCSAWVMIPLTDSEWLGMLRKEAASMPEIIRFNIDHAQWDSMDRNLHALGEQVKKARRILHAKIDPGFIEQNVKGMATRGSEPARSPEEVEPSHENDQTASSRSPSPPCSGSSLLGVVLLLGFVFGIILDGDLHLHQCVLDRHSLVIIMDGCSNANGEGRA